MLKNSLSTPNSPKLGDTKCLEIRKNRLNRIVMQKDFRQFLEKEFFSHACLRQLTSGLLVIGEVTANRF